MARTACIILGLAFMALGIWGITGTMPMFQSDPIYINIGEIILGSFGFLIGYLPETANSKCSYDSKDAKYESDNQ
jgi:hypothetical protein